LFLAFQRRFDEALVHMGQAQLLDPLRVETTMDLASLHAWIGNSDEAYRLWKAAEEIDPGYVGLHQSVVSGFCGTQWHAESIAAFERGDARYPGDPLITSELAYCNAAAGDTTRARELFVELDGLSDEMYVSPISRAMVLVGLGEHARALDELERGARERDHHLLYLSIDRVWDPLRDDPRFAELLDQIGIPQA
jgi:tetratricopeptide (TPR) repeat protein